MRRTLTTWLPRAPRALAILFAALFTVASVQAVGPGDTGRIYSSSEDIGRAQAILERTGYLKADSYRNGDADGTTVRAIRAFQAMHNLPRTGWLDSETMAELTSHALAMDRDLDNVVDDLDLCPDTPSGQRVDARGCARGERVI